MYSIFSFLFFYLSLANKLAKVSSLFIFLFFIFHFPVVGKRTAKLCDAILQMGTCTRMRIQRQIACTVDRTSSFREAFWGHAGFFYRVIKVSYYKLTSSLLPYQETLLVVSIRGAWRTICERGGWVVEREREREREREERERERERELNNRPGVNLWQYLPDFVLEESYLTFNIFYIIID